MSEMTTTCAQCPYYFSKRLCNTEEGKGLDNCPTLHKRELLEESNRLYKDPEIYKFAKNASIQEGEGYAELDGKVRAIKPRILEIVEFAQKMEYKKLGLIFCEGLSDEAKAVDKFLRGYDFDVISVVCKSGRTPKEKLDILDEQKIVSGTFEPICNPIYQAFIVNDANVEFNIMMGLCVGHDSLVIKYLKSPVTILASKDRLLAHNPLAAVYNMSCYYAFIKK